MSLARWEALCGLGAGSSVTVESRAAKSVAVVGHFHRVGASRRAEAADDVGALAALADALRAECLEQADVLERMASSLRHVSGDGPAGDPARPSWRWVVGGSHASATLGGVSLSVVRRGARRGPASFQWLASATASPGDRPGPTRCVVECLGIADDAPSAMAQAEAHAGRVSLAAEAVKGGGR